MRQQIFLLCVVTFMVIFAVFTLNTAPIQNNLAGQQAISFLQGKLDIPDTAQNRGGDAAIYNGKAYSPFPPLPALLLIPFIVLFGPAAPMSLVLVPTFVITGWYFWRTLQIENDIGFPKYWLLAAFLFGSPVWPTLMYGSGVWYSSQLIGMMCVVIALWASFTKLPRKYLYVGLGLTAGFLCRQSMILLLPVFLVILWEAVPQDKMGNIRYFIRQIIPLCICLAIGGILYLLFNYLRFGNPLDTGYEYIVPGGVLGLRLTSYGVFSTHYVLFNTIYFLFQGFHIQFGGPDMLQVQGIDLFGTALIVASPFLVASLYARPSRLLLVTSWVMMGIMIAYELFYHNNGFVQINSQRFSMDYLPLLMLLTAWGVKRFPTSFVKGTILWAIGLNFISIVVAFLSFGIPKT